MPEEGIKYLPKKELFTFEEMERLVVLLAQIGITKVRLTGGEPFVRNDLMQLIRRIVEIDGIKDVHIIFSVNLYFWQSQAVFIQYILSII